MFHIQWFVSIGGLHAFVILGAHSQVLLIERVVHYPTAGIDGVQLWVVHYSIVIL